ncbi:site-specific integrase [Paraburkholderia graminis]|uniref:site-specific integrase n=1 Tax=Paraburkholderia graminis TaxID=60548 RepID=UPI0003FC29FB
MKTLLLNELLASFEYNDDTYAIPTQVIDSKGQPVDTSSDMWRLNGGVKRLVIDWDSFSCPSISLEYVLKRYVIDRIERCSSVEAYNLFRQFCTSLPETAAWEQMRKLGVHGTFGVLLKNMVSEILAQLKHSESLWKFARIRAWYVWVADEFPSLIVSEFFLDEIQNIRIPGNLKGHAVSTNDPDEGPLSPEEVQLVQRALQDDSCWEFESVQQRAAVALCLAYGRNPSNYALLRECDLVQTNPGVPLNRRVFVINMPRIKKRDQDYPRQHFIQEYCDDGLLLMIEFLIGASRHIDTGHLPRPLFSRQKPFEWDIRTPNEPYAWHMDPTGFTNLVRNLSKRLGLVSPRTGRSLRLTPRRLRYTYAVAMVRMGVSKEVLMLKLDHTDMQNLQVYLDLRDDQLALLDAAGGERLSEIVGFFKGTVVAGPDDAINGHDPARRVIFLRRESPEDAVDLGACGQHPRCFEHPPFSCYGCPKFQPFVEAEHGKVLDYATDERSRYLEAGNENLAEQMNVLIAGVKEAIAKVKVWKEERANGGG